MADCDESSAGAMKKGHHSTVKKSVSKTTKLLPKDDEIAHLRAEFDDISHTLKNLPDNFPEEIIPDLKEKRAQLLYELQEACERQGVPLISGLSHSDDDDGSNQEEKRKHDDDDDDDEDGEDVDGVALDDPAPKKIKITMGFNKTFGTVKTIGVNEKKNVAPITIKLGPQKTKENKSALQKASASVASVFNQESDEEEEMPPEAKMRMRNIGRDTPTSAGPNSFGKTRQGFCDSKKVFERQLKEKMEEVADK